MTHEPLTAIALAAFLDTWDGLLKQGIPAEVLAIKGRKVPAYAASTELPRKDRDSSGGS